MKIIKKPSRKPALKKKQTNLQVKSHETPAVSPDTGVISPVFFWQNQKFYAYAAALLLAAGLVALGWFWGHGDVSYDPYKTLKDYQHSRHGFIVKSAEVSLKLANRAVEALKNRNIDEAVEDCKAAIDIFPINAKPYIILTKLYLMLGQEQKMYDTLTLTGRSYPNFNNIVSVIDDEDLDKLPLEEPKGNIFLAHFPENKKMAMSYMFDDGESNVYKALPAFEKYGYRATIPVVAGFVSDKSGDPFWGSWAEWRDAANRGFEIANHSMYHRDSRNLHGDDFNAAIDQAHDLIEKNTGHPVTAYVFPHDSYTDEAVSRALRLHKAVRAAQYLRSFYERTVDIVFGGPYVSIETANRLVDIGIKRELWLIAKCHGVTKIKSLRSFKSITPEFLEANLAYIHSRASEIWVDTFSNVFEYLFLRSQTTVEILGPADHPSGFILRNNNDKARLTRPLTVVIKTRTGYELKSALGEDGHALKAWACAFDQFCVDDDAYGQKVYLKTF